VGYGEKDDELVDRVVEAAIEHSEPADKAVGMPTSVMRIEEHSEYQTRTAMVFKVR